MIKKDYEPKYEYKENQYYKEYEKLKEEIKSKYPAEIFIQDYSTAKVKKDYLTKERFLYQQYLKELTDLIFQPDGLFQKFIWDVMSEVEKLEMERRTRGRMGNGEYR